MSKITFDTTLVVNIPVYKRNAEKMQKILEENKFMHTRTEKHLCYDFDIRGNIKRLEVLRRLLLNAELI